MRFLKIYQKNNGLYFLIKRDKLSSFFNEFGKMCGASQMTQVKNMPTMQEMQGMWVQALGQKDPLEEGMATHSSILAWRNP